MGAFNECLGVRNVFPSAASVQLWLLTLSNMSRFRKRVARFFATKLAAEVWENRCYLTLNFAHELFFQSEFSSSPWKKAALSLRLYVNLCSRYLSPTTQCLSKEGHFTRSFLRSEALFSSYRGQLPFLLCSLSFFVGFPTPLDDTLDFPPLHSWTSHARFVYCDLSIQTKANFLK